MRLLHLAPIALAAIHIAPPSRAQTIPMTPQLQAVIDGARKEGQLDIRSTSTVLGGPEGLKVAQEGVKRLFGVDLKANWTPGPPYGPLAALLNQERQAGRKSSSDALLATAVQMSTYVEQGLFAKADWQNYYPSRVTPEIVEMDGRFLRVRTTTPSILYNVAEAPWAAKIKKFDEVLDPKLKGQFFTTPLLAGFDVMLSDDKWGVAATTERVKKLTKQIGGLVGCEGVDRIASGEIPALVMECGNGYPNITRFRGQNIIATRIIPETAQKRYSYIGVPTNAPHPNAGILYALYIASSEGQSKLVWDYFGSDLDSMPDAQGRKELAAIEQEGGKFVEVTFDWWRKHPGIDKINEDLAKIVREP